MPSWFGEYLLLAIFWLLLMLWTARTLPTTLRWVKQHRKSALFLILLLVCLLFALDMTDLVREYWIMSLLLLVWSVPVGLYLKKHWVLGIFLAAFLSYYGTIAAYNYSGYCWEQKRWLSDEEFLLAMLGYVSDGKSSQNIKKGIRSTETKENLQKFLRENPECCSFTRGSVGMHSTIDWLNRATGSMYAAAVVEYELPEAEKYVGKYNTFPYYREYLTINACGETNVEAGEKITEEEYRR